MKPKPLRVVELFAGVGGFRIALEGYPKKKHNRYEVIWSNQYEPKTKVQHANLVYQKRFPKAHHSQEDIETIVANKIHSIPHHDVLVGGFPCQDYSIANRSHNKGIEGTKGKLWWAIYTLLQKKGKYAPKYLILENVDRLLRSPRDRKGRDFGVILSCLNQLGYAVEWRVINAADYGYPQKRKRVYILAYRKGTKLYRSVQQTNPEVWLTQSGVFAKSFRAKAGDRLHIQDIPQSIEETLNNFSNENNLFENAGVMIQGTCYHIKLIPQYSGSYTMLKDVLLDPKDVPPPYFYPKNTLSKWKEVKGAKVSPRISKQTNEPYLYREGKVAFPDPLDQPARTILTKEIERHICREKHIVRQGSRYRGLHPIELERLNGFPDDFTACEGVTDIKRGFFMGNALIIGIVHTIAKQLHTRIFNP